MKLHGVATTILLALLAMVASAFHVGGHDSRLVETRILGGTNSTKGQWPFAVSFHSTYGTAHFCGGTIISPSCIISAGHCFQRDIGTGTPADSKVAVGITHLPEKRESLEFQKLKKIYVHEKYDKPKPFFNDVSLVILEKPLKFSNLVQPAIPSTTKYTDGDVIGKKGVAIGWGNVKYMKQGSALSPDLLYVRQNVWTHAKCKSTIPNMADWEDCLEIGKPRKECVGAWFYHESMVCAGGVKGEDACQGDSGGPFVYKRPDGKNVLVGVVSVGNACGLADNPAIYTNVGYYRDWIKQKCPDFEKGGRPSFLQQ